MTAFLIQNARHSWGGLLCKGFGLQWCRIKGGSLPVPATNLRFWSAGQDSTATDNGGSQVSRTQLLDKKGFATAFGIWGKGPGQSVVPNFPTENSRPYQTPRHLSSVRFDCLRSQLVCLRFQLPRWSTSTSHSEGHGWSFTGRHCCGGGRLGSHRRGSKNGKKAIWKGESLAAYAQRFSFPSWNRSKCIWVWKALLQLLEGDKVSAAPATTQAHFGQERKNFRL